MRLLKLYLIMMLVLMLGTISLAFSQVNHYNFDTINLPVSMGTGVGNGINNSGQIVGVYLDDNSRVRGFMLSDGDFTEIDFPGASNTFVSGINESGQIVGDYSDAAGNFHGFMLSDGDFTEIDFPDASDTFISGINESGVIVGTYFEPGRVVHAFLWEKGNFEGIDFPGVVETLGFGINSAGTIVGEIHSTEVLFHGYTRSRGGDFQTIDFSGAFGTMAYGINASNMIIGQYFEADSSQPLGFNPDRPRGYLLIGNDFVEFDFPNAPVTGPIGINDVGQIVGFYDDIGGSRHGFIATPEIGTAVLSKGKLATVWGAIKSPKHE